MFKHLKNILLLGTIMLLLAACSTPTAQATMQPTGEPIPGSATDADDEDGEAEIDTEEAP